MAFSVQCLTGKMGLGESAPVSELALFVRNRQYRGSWVG